MPKLRTIVASMAGSLAYLLILFRFLSYSERNKLPGDVYVIFATVALVVGFAVSLGATANRYRSAGFVLLGVCLSHLLIIIVDYQQDPSSHNLAPFEFAILCLVSAPAYAGAAIAHLVDYITRNVPMENKRKGRQ